MTPPALPTSAWAAGGSESLPTPTLFVIVYATLWFALVGWLAWLATRQQTMERSICELGDELRSRLEQAEARRPPGD